MIRTVKIISINPRYPYIKNTVLSTYKRYNITQFPIDVLAILKSTPNCAVLSYYEFAKKYNVTVEDVILMCDSTSGCTHYEKRTGRYLVLYNNGGTVVSGRVLWTLAHELGHIMLSHLPELSTNMASENGFSNLSNQLFEREAESFASNFLAPLPLFDFFNIRTSHNVKDKFGLSNEAANNAVKNYTTWKRTRYKTAYENDMVNWFQSAQLICSTVSPTVTI